MPAISRRTWTVVSASAAAAALVAGVAVAGWALTRPGDSAGQDLADLRAGEPPAPVSGPATEPTMPGAASTPPGAAPALPRPAVRDASLDALAAPAASPPSRLVIPDLGVDASVDAVGVQPDGAMVIPASPTSVGWYQYGSAPADPAGNTVIAGHVATREDGPGALAPLVEARPGMRIEVTASDGTVHSYEVAGREAIVKEALPVDQVFARDGRPLLVLVTCGGEYLPELRSHRDNIVVTAVPVT
ncbi:MAG: class F sortase [Kineosporiaceae bacterium]